MAVRLNTDSREEILNKCLKKRGISANFALSKPAILDAMMEYGKKCYAEGGDAAHKKPIGDEEINKEIDLYFEKTSGTPNNVDDAFRYAVNWALELPTLED